MNDVPQPTPQAEIVLIPRIVPGGLSSLDFYVASLDAQLWLEAEAPKFGQLFDERRYWRLWVSPNFDARQVADYLMRGYQAEAKDDAR